jgi:hypothetical protein
MPIRTELRPLYPPHWRELSSHVRFERAGGKCQRCGRPHLVLLRCLPDGRWFDKKTATWRDRRGRPARWPDLVEAILHPIVGRVAIQVRRCEHDARHPKPSRLHKIGPSGRAPSAVPPGRSFFVEPAPVRQAAKESEVRSATALAFSSSALEAHVAAQLVPVRRIERSQLRPDWHGYAASLVQRRIAGREG